MDKDKTNKDIVKAPPKTPIPKKQYSANLTTQGSPEEQAETFLAHLTQGHANINNSTTSRASLHYLHLFQKEVQHLCIVDGGADTHVGGKAWLSLIDLNDPMVKKVNVVGFDEHTTKKIGLPVGIMVTKCILNSGETKFLRAKHMIVNQNSNHTLLAPYQM